MRTIKVGSRQSALALTQTGHVIQDLRDICEREGLAFDFEVHKIVTKGESHSGCNVVQSWRQRIVCQRD